jgi:putative MATE family efflux protein
MAIVYNSRAMFTDRTFYKNLLRLAAPITVQQLIMCSLNIVDVMMVGQMGETAIAGVGLANQVFFILSILVFGSSSGGAIFMAQFWGKKDIVNLRRVLGLTLIISTGCALVLSLLAILAPSWVMHIFTEDAIVINTGSQYLRIAGFSYVFTAITYCYSATLRSTESVRLPVLINVLALGLNTSLNYLLIFGKFGFPQMGVQGAAVATVISRFLESTILLIIIYKRKSTAAASMNELLDQNKAFSARYLKTVAPVVFNELIWSLGVSTYSVIYARMNTDAVAAVNIANAIDRLSFVAFIGIGNACMVMVGNKIGAGDEATSFNYARRSLLICLVLGIGVGLLIMAIARPIISIYKVEQITAQNAFYVLLIYMIMLWARGANMILFVGILRAGGDTRFGFYTELCTMWLIGVPLSAIGAFIFHLPIYWVVAFSMLDEISKCAISFFRYRSKKWIHFLAYSPEELS